MKKYLIILIVALVLIVGAIFIFHEQERVLFSPEEEVMLVEIEWRAADGLHDEEMSILNVIKREAVYVEPTEETSYYLDLYDFDDDFIGGAHFPVYFSNKIVIEGDLDEGIPGAVLEQTTTKFVAIVPYVENVKNIVLAKGDEVIGIENIGVIANVCGDEECQPHESFISCPEDCASSEKDGYCNNVPGDGCDSDCLDLSPPEQPFMLDTEDCGIQDAECEGVPVCYHNAVFICLYDKEFRANWFLMNTCQRGEGCEGGYCSGDFNIIEGVVCEDDKDCVVNQESWVCVCGTCTRPGFGYWEGGQMCCNERLCDNGC